MIHGEPTWDCFSLSKAPLSSLLKGKVELSGLWHDDVMVRKWKFALLLVFKDETAFCYRALHHHHQERVLSLSSPSSPTGLKGRMEERLSLLPNHGCQIQHAWGGKKKFKKNEWYFLRTAVSPRGKGQLEGWGGLGCLWSVQGLLEEAHWRRTDGWGNWQRDTEPFTSRSPGSNTA